jgi:hypothetical protein
VSSQGLQSETQAIEEKKEIMKNSTRTLFVGAALAAFLLPASAQTATPDPNVKKPATIPQRKENQQQRIGEGVENGSLTAGEAARLEGKEAAINRETRRMKADGNFTPAERARVQRQQNRLSGSIYKQKHDAQVQNTNPKTEIGQRKENQQKRIGEGIENGSLTAGEAARVERKEAALNRETRNMRAENGSTLTPADKAKVNRQQNRLSKNIYHQKHDRQHR